MVSFPFLVLSTFLLLGERTAITTTEAWLSPSSLHHRSTSASTVAIGIGQTKQTYLRVQSTESSSESGSGSSSSGTNDYNVVLRPSEDASAFDSFKIGAARVHRYARADSDGDSEYVMWYHGRNHELDNTTPQIPPLSTGRIGRATSRNGLHWERNTVGSESETEDIDGVSLGLNKESWWGFDTAHVGLGQVLLPMSTPAVMTEGGVYLMYYMGGSFEETNIGKYLDKELPEGMAEKKIAGMNMKIGVALSQDGISFGRVEGDDPTGAIMAPYDASDPNMKYILQLRDDDGSRLDIPEELYCAWPEVAVNDLPEDTREEKKMKSFYMYYSTMLKSTKEKAIAFAVSEDGFRWFKRGLCVVPEEGTLDAGGCARCNVLRKAKYDEDNGTWRNDNGWIMLYEGVSKEDGKHRIMAAESDDLRNWSKIGVALNVGEDGAWDSDGVGAPHVLRLDDGTSRMYYTGQSKDGSTSIGVAKSIDDIEFSREQAQFSFST